MTRTLALVLGLGSLAVTAAPVQAQIINSMWERRDPKNSNLFWDYRARQVGDVLTIVINETTESDAQESRNLNKQTNTNANINLNGTSQIGSQMMKQFTSTFTGQLQSQRKFDGTANTTIDRKFLDNMSVLVVGVFPNGNLLIEGYRTRVVAREARTLRMTGICRPADIGPFNQIQSQYIADLAITYAGKGPESNYTNHGWGGRLMNVLWPF